MALRKNSLLCGMMLLICLHSHDILAQLHVGTSHDVEYDYLDARGVPTQPTLQSMHFIEDLKSPMWIRHPWYGTDAGQNRADLSRGVTIKKSFSDPHARLKTAYQDLIDFLSAGSVPTEDGQYIIETVYTAGLEHEAYRIDIAYKSCRILASDTEGIRRGIFYIEDEMLSNRGPFLPLGTSDHFPAIKKRIIRGYFSPTKRPGSRPRVANEPIVIDELMNDIDYYPAQYLNRLAHQGVNGLWLSLSGYDDDGERVGFGDLVSTSVTPTAGVNGEKRIEKLKRVVEKCLSYGIKTYLFTIEPGLSLPESDPLFRRFEESDLIGNKRVRNLCASTELGQTYLQEATFKIFSAIPELGGLINISHGERFTTCLSSIAATGRGEIACPRCVHMPKWEILHKALSAMERGMHKAAPEADLISWLYMPQPQSQSATSIDTLADWVYDIPAHTPEGVILQFNYTTGVQKTVFGKELMGGDYWLMPAGPSPRFERIAQIGKDHGVVVSAKIQTGTSHEVTTVPYVPVPSALYNKFAAMRRLGIEHTMLTWYFGNAPGLMVKAAGLLALDSLPEEGTFLTKLASIYWKEKDVPSVVKAWKHFERGYANYPLTNRFQYFGPMHDAPVWPLLLKPRDEPLSPTWLQVSMHTLEPWPPSGDRVGDCFTDLLSLEEVVTLCEQMTTEWDKGVDLLNQLRPDYDNEPNRILDIGVAKAIGIQFRSGYNILRFYLLREKMLNMTGPERLSMLMELKEIVYEELELSEQLLLLSRQDSRLGYHPEAVGYKYHPAKIRWRMDLLKRSLTNDFPEVERLIKSGASLFPGYTGVKPEGLVAESVALTVEAFEESTQSKTVAATLPWQSFQNGHQLPQFQWSSVHDADGLTILVKEALMDQQQTAQITSMLVRIQPRRLWPGQKFTFTSPDRSTDERLHIQKSEDAIFAWVRIPWTDLGADRNPDRIKVDVQIETDDGQSASWCELIGTTSRLEHGSINPNDFGWLVLKK